MELTYFHEPDYLFKYCVTMAAIMIGALIIIISLNGPNFLEFWIISLIVLIGTLIMIPISWSHKIFNGNDLNEYNATRSKTRIIILLHQLSKNLATCVTARFLIYLVIFSGILATSLIYWARMNPCLDNRGHNNLEDSNIPWITTKCIILTVCVCYQFTKIHFVIKFFLSLITLGVYSWVMFGRKNFYFNQGNTFNKELEPQFAHLFKVIVTIFLLHLTDRQREYIMRVDFNWKHHLIIKKKESKRREFCNEILLQNILPPHVITILNRWSPVNEFYYEEHNNVAVMFATIVIENLNNAEDKPISRLMILNTMIGEFDRVLLSQTSTSKLEKIKVAGWTYMAASGLHENIEQTNDPRSSSPMFVMINFALQLLKSAKESSDRVITPQMRIGIAFGPVAAGVIGSQKPLYDIWGNTVNMASRMESSGCVNKIQLTQEAANDLKSFGVATEYRGMTQVKGVGPKPTYFACYDENFQLIIDMS